MFRLQRHDVYCIQHAYLFTRVEMKTTDVHVHVCGQWTYRAHACETMWLKALGQREESKFCKLFVFIKS